MSARYEGAGAADVQVTILKAGEEIGQDVVPEGQVALVFNYDEVFYVQGTMADLWSLLERARWQLQHLEKERNMTTQYVELANTIANQAAAIAEGHFQGPSLRAQVALLKNNINTLEAWTPGEEEDEPHVRTDALGRPKR